MNRLPEFWDYLILTASNDLQARAYQDQLRLRSELGLLARVRRTLVVADPGGRRIGSGGSTVHCLATVLEREGGSVAPEQALRRLRIMIIHAGGDSRRLPAYGPCGKIFVPAPGESHSALGSTLFDRLAPSFLDLPSAPPGAGQVVVAAGDALIRFDSSALRFAGGMTALGAYATLEEASRHGVFCLNGDGGLRLYLQKPRPQEQVRLGAVDPSGRSALDIGVMNFDAAAAAALLRVFQPEAMRAAVLARGLDLYREICCALGSDATLRHYVDAARASGSAWDDALLAELFESLHSIPCHVRLAPGCSFLHFGSTRQLASSGLALAVQDHGVLPDVTALSVNNEVSGAGGIAGFDSWVEGCRLAAPLRLGGRNVVVGVDVGEPLALPPNACLDVLPGRARDGRPVWFVRCYGVDDTFKDNVFCGRPLAEWLAAVGLREAPQQGGLWDARVFPAETDPLGYRRWLWMFNPETATAGQKRAFIEAERYSAAETATLADRDAFHERRGLIRASSIRRTLNRLFSPDSPFSAEDLAFAMERDPGREAWTEELLALARSHLEAARGGSGMESFLYCRIVHSLGAALGRLGSGGAGEDLCAEAFRQLNETILASSLNTGQRPRQALRPDETIWGRGPARIELGGGWTDTPPYTLEYGGDVANVAVNLNGQPPIHCYCRIVGEPVIRLGSIDGGRRVEIRELPELLDYRRPEDRFALAKAALAISGFSPEMADWPPGVTLARMLEEFGGGIELTTLVGIPKGSGLGTSSILGAVIIAVLRRMMGRAQNQREIFHDVLRLEQALTTGGGWQDQIGGGVGGAKITSTRPGLFPDPHIHYVPSDVLDPRANGGSTLLYYTGMTRLAKNILQQIVGGYFNRNRAIMAALAEEHQVAHSVADALSRKDAAAAGRYVNAAWELQKRLCGEVTNEEIERLLAKVRPHVHGMRISGAGSGGFLFMIAKSPRDAALIRERLEREPLNERARFFDFEVNQAGLEVTTC